MKIIKREMKSNKTETSFDGWKCQASFNSNGNITLRNYIPDVPADKDEIIILNDSETQAILQLFRKLKLNDFLPF